MLAGGASYGAVQVGQLRALAKTDITPDMIVGTSVGALNGTVVAEDPSGAVVHSDPRGRVREDSAHRI